MTDNSRISSRKQAMWAAAALLIGATGAGTMIALGDEPTRATPQVQAQSVRVSTALVTDAPRSVEARGVVVPARQVTLMPQVAGQITRVSPELIPGGRVAKGDTLISIDSRDYGAAVAEAEARVQKARLDLALEEGRSTVAAKEWKTLGSTSADSSLALRAPQLATARLGLVAAEAGLTRAKLALERTRIRAPFDAVVITEQVDVGQVVGPGSPVATLVGTDALWVTVALPVDKLSALAIPQATGELASPATIRQTLGDGTQVVRTGEVLRLVGQLDPQTRNAQVLVRIDAPMQADAEGHLLLPGAYVDVLLEGPPLPGAVTIPRTALRDGDVVWTVKDGLLDRRVVKLAGGTTDTVLIRSGLTEGAQVVTSGLALPRAGMAVRIVPSRQ